MVANLQGLYRMIELPDSVAVGLYSGNASVICREKGVSHHG
jgi:hypothetical protein